MDGRYSVILYNRYNVPENEEENKFYRSNIIKTSFLRDTDFYKVVERTFALMCIGIKHTEGLVIKGTVHRNKNLHNYAQFQG